MRRGWWLERGRKVAVTVGKMALDDENEEERRRRLKIKNWTLFALLFGFVVVVYLVSIVRMSG